MQQYNLIVVFSPDLSKVLVCKRRKNPYLGLYNFVGGHIEAGESGYEAAYRELWEETSITKEDIRLTYLMKFDYPLSDCSVEAYFGRLPREISVAGEENDLEWISVDQNFFDMKRFAGEGNMGHIIEQIKINWGILEEKENDLSHELIRDNGFSTGFQVLSQKDHANGDRIHTLGQFSYPGAVGEPLWELAQWDSGPCLWENQVTGGDPFVLTDGTWRALGVNLPEKKLTFRLDTELYYQGKGAVFGDYWPHLLIEQRHLGYDPNSSTAEFYSCDGRMTVSFDLRLTEFKAAPHSEDWVQAAQFLMYFYVKGKKTNDFVWFGLHLFDSREEPLGLLGDVYMGYDGLKADASGAMIYNIGSKDLYRDCAIMAGDWVHVELELTEHLRAMFERGRTEGYFKADSLSDLVINGMNVGWETIGTFAHTMELKNLSLRSERDGFSE